MTEPTVTVMPLDLSTAGEEQIDQEFAVLRVIRADGGAGTSQDLSALINLQLGRNIGTSNKNEIPLGVSNGYRGPTVQGGKLSWEAQPGITRCIIFLTEHLAMDIDADPAVQQLIGSLAASFASSSITVGTSATLLAASNADRESLSIYNDGSATIYLGGSGVSTATGTPVPVGGSFTFSGTSAAVYAISGSAGQDVRVLQEG